jgi:hypothetical protein
MHRHVSALTVGHLQGAFFSMCSYVATYMSEIPREENYSCHNQMLQFLKSVMYLEYGYSVSIHGVNTRRTSDPRTFFI